MIFVPAALSMATDVLLPVPLRVMLLPPVVPIVYPPALRLISPRLTFEFSVTVGFAAPAEVKDAVSEVVPDGVPG